MGEHIYEKIKIITLVVIVFVIFFYIHSWSGLLCNYFFPAEEIERELNRAERNNKEARNITAEVTEGLGKTGDRLASATERLGKITDRVSNIQIEAKKTGRDLGRAESLIEESLCILEKIEKEGKSR